jgi:predicted phage terminase large subunit-like protein
MAPGHGAPAGEPERCREIAARHHQAGRQTGSHRVRPGTGQAGKNQAFYLVRALSGFTVTPAPETGDKLTPFGPFSSQCRAGNVKIRRRSWNEELFRVLERFPDLAHADEVDACSSGWKCSIPQCRAGARMRSGAKTPRRSVPRSNASRKAPHPIRPAVLWNGKLCRKNRKTKVNRPRLRQ